ncbi:MAG: hemerythrin domain-containing protein [Bacteroidota bacterium]|jgi:regulator of cell morphogenesis and NO signaling|nr:hemerythrin domain-containing protein [Bacteroidota bacterium]
MIRRQLFNENSQLADLLLVNINLMHILPRFKIDVGVGESTVKQICEERNISIPLFLMVCKVYSLDNYTISQATVDRIPVDQLLGYLHNSHTDYIENRVPSVIRSIIDITQSSYSSHFKAFLQKYKEDTDIHFAYEEEVLFPYINALLNGEKTERYNIKEFQANHTNIQESLNDLKNLLVKYAPLEVEFEKKRKAISELFLLEEDLNKHHVIEDEILVAVVSAIEKELR